jgi:LCP family protein required for cell wall assembly
MAGGSPAQPTRPKPKRTWPQRLTITGAFVCAIAAFGAAGVLYAGQRVIEDRNISPTIINPATNTSPTIAPHSTTATGASLPADTGPPPTFPVAEPGAKNFLITGADNNACVDPDSAYAPAFGDRSNIGERSDTIMMWRINPDTSQVAVLSFPRDLWVTIAGRSSKQRINTAYERDNPQQLIDTIRDNFGIDTDHFIQVDFCAFKTLVDAVDGVTVPFATPVRDPSTGLKVDEAGCHTFDGDHALAYVRSRHFETYTDEDGWETDPTSDLGRISRQQDFLRRTIDRLLDKGAFDPDVAGALIDTVSEYIVTDPTLTPRKMLEFAGVMSQVDPTQIATYQIESRGTTIQGNSVLEPRLEGDNMLKILAVFRGWATLADAPEQVFDTTTVPVSTTTTTILAPTTTVRRGSTQPTTATTTTTTTTTTATTATTALPTVDAEENIIGVAPDPNAVCQ